MSILYFLFLFSFVFEQRRVKEMTGDQQGLFLNDSAVVLVTSLFGGVLHRVQMHLGMFLRLLETFHLVAVQNMRSLKSFPYLTRFMNKSV